MSGSLPITVQWFKDDTEVQTDDKHKCTFFESVALLEISNLNSKDSGSYTCIAKNKAGSVQCSGLLFVKGLGTNVFCECLSDCASVSDPKPCFQLGVSTGGPFDFPLSCRTAMHSRKARVYECVARLEGLF